MLREHLIPGLKFFSLWPSQFFHDSSSRFMLMSVREKKDTSRIVGHEYSQCSLIYFNKLQKGELLANSRDFQHRINSVCSMFGMQNAHENNRYENLYGTVEGHFKVKTLRSSQLR